MRCSYWFRDVFIASSILLSVCSGCSDKQTGNGSHQRSQAVDNQMTLERMDDTQPLGEFIIRDTSISRERPNVIVLLWLGDKFAENYDVKADDWPSEFVDGLVYTFTGDSLWLGGESIRLPDGSADYVVRPTRFYHAVVLIEDELWSGVFEFCPLRIEVNGAIVGESQISNLYPNRFPAFDSDVSRFSHAQLAKIDYNSTDSDELEILRGNWTSEIIGKESE